MKTRSFKIWGLILAGMLFLTVPAKAQQMTAKELVNKSYNLFLGKSSFSVMTMEIVRPSWSRSISMQAWSLGEDYYIALIMAPARDKGQVFLKYDKDMWNFIPAINRVIKIPPSMMMQSWMGSDFTNNDLMKQNSIVKDYTHKYNGSATIDGYDCYEVDLTPLPDAAVVWGSIKMWISKKNYNTMKAEFYDTHGKLVKTETATNLKVMGGRLLPTLLVMASNTKQGHKTVIHIQYQKFDVKGVNKPFFSIQRIRNIRPENVKLK